MTTIRLHPERYWNICGFLSDDEVNKIYDIIDNEIAVSEWDDPSVYTPEHLLVLAHVAQICTLKRDYVNIGYYEEKFSNVTD